MVLQGFPSAFSNVLNSQRWLLTFLRTYSLSVSTFFSKIMSATTVLSILEAPFTLSIIVYLGIQVGKAVVLLCSGLTPCTEFSAGELSWVHLWHTNQWLASICSTLSLCWEAWPVSSVCLCISGESKELCCISVTTMDTVVCLHIKIIFDSLFFLQRENKLILEWDPLFC